jgi:hypothetical protein
MTLPRTRDDCLLLAISRDVIDRHVVSKPKDLWCWHCCHPFEGLGIPLPMAYDDKRKTWKTKGTFCSFACIKAYNCENSNHNGVRSMLLTLFKKRITGKLTSTIPAPPRCCLRVFGGTMTIEEFRAKSADGFLISELPPKMIPLETIIHERKVEAKKVAARPGPNLQTEIDLTTTTQKNETLRLKRPRPMPSSSDVLARTMGLEFFPVT